MQFERGAVGWIVVSGVVVAAILIPFLLYGEALDAYSARVLSDQRSRLALGMIAASLLASDVLLPIPSSVVSTIAGRMLGFVGGTLASTIGMSAACVIGYGMGRSMGRAAVIRLAGEDSLAQAARVVDRFGLAALVVLRPVPVVAEASTLLAGTTGLPPTRFLIVTTLANLAISAVYAGAGGSLTGTGSFLLAFAAAMLLPGIAMLATKAWRKRSAADNRHESTASARRSRRPR